MSEPETATVESTPRVVIHPEQCKGCGLCVAACPKGVLVQSDRTNRFGYRFTRAGGQGCTGCGICFYNCPEPGAITVHRRRKNKTSQAK